LQDHYPTGSGYSRSKWLEVLDPQPERRLSDTKTGALISEENCPKMETSRIGSDERMENNLINSIKLAKIFVILANVLVRRLESWSTRYRNIHGLCCEKTLPIKHIEIILVNKVGQQLLRQTV